MKREAVLFFKIVLVCCIMMTVVACTSKVSIDDISSEQTGTLEVIESSEMSSVSDIAQTSENQAVNTTASDVTEESVSVPWKSGGKQPNDYTLEEFEKLSEIQQMVFIDDIDDFEEWMKRVKPETNEDVKPWDGADAKQPNEYTWEEFEALSETLQMMFIDDIEDFEAWMTAVKPSTSSENEKPWEAPNAKQPNEYTWEEFEALSETQQMMFIDDIDDFEAWKNRVNPESTEYEKPWDAPNAKQPNDYTWEEFEALSVSLQMMFVDDIEDFEEWMNRVKPESTEYEKPWDSPNAKQPNDYTWEEFESLTQTQQMMFIDEIEDFEAWMARVKP